MLFSIFLQNLLLNNIQQREDFETKEPDGVKVLYLYIFGYSPRYYYKFRIIDYIILAIFYLTAILMSLYSAYLSFSCTWKGTVSNVFLRGFSAIFAFMLGPLYLIWYFFINYLGKMC